MPPMASAGQMIDYCAFFAQKLLITPQHPKTVSNPSNTQFIRNNQSCLLSNQEGSGVSVLKASYQQCRLKSTAATRTALTFDGTIDKSRTPHLSVWSSTPLNSRGGGSRTCDFETLNTVYVQAWIDDASFLARHHRASCNLRSRSRVRYKDARRKRTACIARPTNRGERLALISAMQWR